MTACRAYAQICKRSTEEVWKGFNLWPFCVRKWQAGTYFANGQTVRPLPRELGGRRGITGCAYSSSGGHTGGTEPKWPTTLGATIVDGGVTWTCVAISDADLERTIDDVQWEAGEGVTVLDSELHVGNGRVEIEALHGGGTDGKRHLTVAHVQFSDQTKADFGVYIDVDDGLVD